MKRLRVEQRKGESADLFALRAFALAMPHMDINAVRAFAGWIWDRSQADYRAKMLAATIDGLTCVEWVKKRRNESDLSLREAKDEWDRRVAAQC